MRIEKIVLRLLEMELVREFEISVGKIHKRRIILVEFHSEDNVGYGECTAGEGPFFSYETYDTALIIMQKYLVKRIIGKVFRDPREFRRSLEFVRGHNMAKASMEYAFWDLYAKSLGKPLYKLYGGIRTRIDAGVSIGIKKNIRELIELIETYLDRGYKRIKIKIKPGYDIGVLKEVREVFPRIKLQVDANASYDLSMMNVLRKLDDFDLLMIEQPLHPEDLVGHAILQSRIRTPICLDESITSIHTTKSALRLGSCKIINIKPPRVGGIIEAMKIHDFSKTHQIGLWIGGMLETGVGKTHLLHIATLPGINYPSDISESQRYWREDIIGRPLTLNRDGTINVPDKPGIGVDVVPDLVEKYQKKVWTYRAL
mgnify:CR=1 FL=1